jgi:hypothetical protein
MKIVRIGLAVILTFVMLYVARSNSRGRPEYVTHTERDIHFEMWTVPKITEFQSDTIRVTTSGQIPPGSTVWFRTSQPEGIDPVDTSAYARLGMAPLPGIENSYFTVVTAGKKGGRFYYFFEIKDNTGKTLATFREPDGSSFFLKYIGDVPVVVTVLHIAFIFATVFCVTMATFYAVPVLIGRRAIRPMAKFLFFAAVFSFLGCYPFGIPMNYYAFEVLWEGVPFGTDATDNKTQMLFIYLLFASLSCLGTLTRGRLGRDIFAPRTLGLIGTGSFAVMLFIYLIPHSIQFSAGFTYAFAYSWIGLITLIYVFGYLHSRRRSGALV